MAIEGHVRAMYARTKYRIPAVYRLTGQHTDGIRLRKTDAPDLIGVMTQTRIAPTYADRRRRQLLHD